MFGVLSAGSDVSFVGSLLPPVSSLQLSLSSGDASPSAVLALHRILRVIQKTLSLGVPGRDKQESFTAKRVACFVVRHSGYMRDGLRWGRAIYPCLYSWCTHIIFITFVPGSTYDRTTEDNHTQEGNQEGTRTNTT